MDTAKIKVTKPRASRAKKQEVIEEVPSLLSKFVFMEKPLALLEIGLKTEKNIVLYGPGGHGKSELTMEFFYEKGINPYVITMGTGMTTDRLFGGLDISQLQEGGSGKIEYLVENSFMNHEYAVFEEMMDAPDFILEQLKDILSSGVFRNGTQVFPIKTRFIVCNTNKTREEFSKNDSLKALMERFPLEHNVVWANYTDVSYNTLLEKRFGIGQIDPIIPFLLQEYVKAEITISPRIALDCYEIYEVCGPDSLTFIAEFAKKPELIADALKKFKTTIKFRELGVEISALIADLNDNVCQNEPQQTRFVKSYSDLSKKYTEINKIAVIDSFASAKANLVKGAGDTINKKASQYANCQNILTSPKKSKIEEALETATTSSDEDPIF